MSQQQNSSSAENEKDFPDLSSACELGLYGKVKEYLEKHPKIDIAKEDKSGMSALEHAEKNKHYSCAALIRQEAYLRYKDKRKQHPFNKKLAEDLENKKKTRTFDEEIFRKAAENDPPAASEYLDTFKSEDGYYYSFTQLEKVFGENTVKTSALESILNDSILPCQMDEKLDLLQHVVLKRVLDIKWELFGARKYFQQLLLYILMLMTMTNIVSSNHTQADMRNIKITGALNNSTIQDVEMELWMQISFFIWVFTIVFCFVGFIQLPNLEPTNFAKLTRWMYDGSYKLELGHVIPQAEVFKNKARAKLLRDTIIWAFFLTALVLGVMYYLFIKYANDLTFKLQLIEAHLYITFTVLWLCALYFLIQEMQEVIGENPWIYTEIEESFSWKRLGWIAYLVFILPISTFFKASYRRYYSSFTNLLQLFTYFIILVPFAIMHYYRILSLIKQLNTNSTILQSATETHDGEWLDSLYFGMGAFCTISLWMLSLQYLEINKTAGYLLPIVQDVMKDVWDFGIFYAVFQCGLTCAFFFIFQQNTDGYRTLWASFCSTYFVMFGENDVDELIPAQTKNSSSNSFQLSSPMLHVALCLRMFHSAVMVVLLLNLLLAMMNKTVDRNWERLQSRALTSYARAVLRLETMLGHNNITRAELMKLTYPGGKTVLNPIFKEPVPIRTLDEVEFKSDDTPDDHPELITKVKDLTQKHDKCQEQIEKVKKEIYRVYEKLGLKCDNDCM